MADLINCCTNDGRGPLSQLSKPPGPTWITSLVPVVSFAPPSGLTPGDPKPPFRWLMYRSYSLCPRRTNSRAITRSITPMHEPANMPFVRMCHELAIKQESTVYQFHNICITLFSHSESPLYVYDITRMYYKLELIMGT